MIHCIKGSSQAMSYSALGRDLNMRGIVKHWSERRGSTALGKLLVRMKGDVTDRVSRPKGFVAFSPLARVDPERTDHRHEAPLWSNLRKGWEVRSRIL